ncbi:MAG TPA: hypothetical protein DDZ41_07840, partial [Flavobacterium sp.]|nr:hypothetical protein [Flavobacterium sp.]
MPLLAQDNFEIAEKLFAENKLAEARKIFENHLKNNPKSPKTIEYLGDIAGKEKKWDIALLY